MGDEHLNTIPTTESDKFIKSCVENLAPNPSESEGENKCDVPAEIIPMEINQHSFNAESDLIGSVPNHDSSVIISLKIDSLFDEFAGELTLLKSFPLGIDETDCHPEKEIRLIKRLLYDNLSPRPPKEIISDISNADIEFFSPFPIPNKDIFPYGTVELSQADRPNSKVNDHRIKHYFGGDVPQLVVPDLQTFPIDQAKYGGIRSSSGT
nr:reverse transcriptase domain-containing protein [Tanacetum cinerariifolium]